jgi:phenylpropionate dioxygenase-like ring-hydroxylating dioxygenase large terminal subunit
VQQTSVEIDKGTGWGRPKQTYNRELAEVGPGTPGGEFLRRYWHPVALSNQVTMRPRNLRILGEDLIIFRDGKGRPGLLLPRCAHRGTTLYYGKVDDNGIRCCYHGWQFDVEGRCIDQPCEPDNGIAHRHKVRQPWYPVQERYGLVFAYMGPPEKKPVLPKWDVLEELDEGEKVLAHSTSYGAGTQDDLPEVAPWNWLQDWENIMDPHHVAILHTSFSGAQFAPEMGIMPDVTWEYTSLGMRFIAYRTLPDGRVMERYSPCLFPNVRSVPDVYMKTGRTKRMRWCVPIDDTHHMHFNAARVPKGFTNEEADALRGRTVGDKIWAEMSEQEHQDFPHDWEAQIGQGPINLHSEEHLASADKGVVMLRRLIREQIRVVQNGGDPIGVTFHPDEAFKRVGAGNYIQGTYQETNP